MPYMKMTCRAGKTKEIAKYYTYWLLDGGEEEESKGKPYHRAAAENK